MEVRGKGQGLRRLAACGARMVFSKGSGLGDDARLLAAPLLTRILLQG
jgi:hypothetical protein